MGCSVMACLPPRKVPLRTVQQRDAADGYRLPPFGDSGRTSVGFLGGPQQGPCTFLSNARPRKPSWSLALSAAWSPSVLGHPGGTATSTCVFSLPDAMVRTHAVHCCPVMNPDGNCSCCRPTARRCFTDTVANLRCCSARQAPEVPFDGWPVTRSAPA